MKKLRWRTGGVLLTALAACLTLAVASAPANAGTCGDTLNDRVDGCGSFADDWTDNKEIKQGSVRSNLNLMWQGILYADGYLPRGTRTYEGKTFTYYGESEINGIFSEKIHYATKKWQRDNGLASIDGQVGPKTWTAAAKWVRYRDLNNPNYMIMYQHGFGSGQLRFYRTGPYGEYFLDDLSSRDQSQPRLDFYHTSTCNCVAKTLFNQYQITIR